jgi:hypothetical protein
MRVYSPATAFAKNNCREDPKKFKETAGQIDFRTVGKLLTSITLSNFLFVERPTRWAPTV